LKTISQWLDRQRALVSLVAGDLRRHGLHETGRRGLPAETVLRCALLKQQRQLSYEELAFHLEDSASFRAFARLPLAWSPKKSVLHRTISTIRPETWEAVNRALLANAKQDKLESGAMVRIESTVTAALMHEPSDSALLWDAVRVMTRLLRQAAALPAAPALQWRDRRRLAKKRARAIEYSRGHDNRRRLYRELIAATRATQAAVQQAAERLADLPGIAAERWRAQLGHYLPLIERILVQSERRVLRGQPVPAGEKLVSLFEPHADIIVKGVRDVQYGHKLNLVTGKSGLILDVVVEAGNPADAERFLPMLSARSPVAACRRGRSPPMAVMPARTISQRPRPTVSAMSPSTRSAAWPSKTWSRAAGSIASCATSAPALRPGSPASSEPTVWHAAPGADSITSRPTSGPRSWPIIWCCSPVSNRLSSPPARSTSKPSRPLSSPSPTRQTILSPAATSKTRAPPHALDPNPILAPSPL
jgi:transposase, IS5 family